MSESLSISPKHHKSSCDKLHSFCRCALGALVCCICDHNHVRRRRKAMTSFDQYRPRPARPVRRDRAALQRRRRRCGCAARSRSSIPWPGAARSGCGNCCSATSRCARSARSPATRRCRWSAPGSKAIYLSGWQVAADANTAGAMYPDQSLYPANTGPELARRINRTLQRADQIEHMRGRRQARLVRADRRRRRGRLRRAAQLLRDHEGLYRGGRRRRPFRGPARVARRSAAISAARC